MVVYDDHDDRHMQETDGTSLRGGDGTQAAPKEPTSPAAKEPPAGAGIGAGTTRRARAKQFPINGKRAVAVAVQNTSLSPIFDNLSALHTAGEVTLTDLLPTPLTDLDAVEKRVQVQVQVQKQERDKARKVQKQTSFSLNATKTTASRAAAAPARTASPCPSSSSSTSSSATSASAPASAPTARSGTSPGGRTAVRDLLLDRPKHWGAPPARAAKRGLPGAAAAAGGDSSGASAAKRRHVSSTSSFPSTQSQFTQAPTQSGASSSQSFRPQWLQTSQQGAGAGAGARTTGDGNGNGDILPAEGITDDGSRGGVDGAGDASLQIVSGHRPPLSALLTPHGRSPETSPSRRRSSASRARPGSLLMRFEKLGRTCDSAALRLLHVAPSKGFDDPRNRAQGWVDATVLRVEEPRPPFRSVLAFVCSVSRRAAGAAAVAPTASEAEVAAEDNADTNAEAKEQRDLPLPPQAGAAAPTAALEGQLVFIHFTDAPCSAEREPRVGRTLRIYDSVLTPFGLVCTQVRPVLCHAMCAGRISPEALLLNIA